MQISDERLFWVGLGLLLATAIVFALRLVRTVKGGGARSQLVDETFQDVALACLGASLLFKKGEPGRLLLMCAFVVAAGLYVARRVAARRRGSDARAL